MTATVIEPGQEAAVLRVAAYHHQLERMVIWSRPEEHDAVCPLVAEPFPTEPGAPSSLGPHLGRLPVELLAAVCACLDVRSCFRLRQANRLARGVVSGLPTYQAVAAHALEALRAVLRTGVATRLTLEDLYALLRTEACGLCGSFAGFLFLPTTTRCCIGCVQFAPEMRVVSLPRVAKDASTSSDKLRPALRHAEVRTVVGYYGQYAKYHVYSVVAVPSDAALDLLRARGAEEDVLEAVAGHSPADDTAVLRCAATVALPYLRQRRAAAAAASADNDSGDGGVEVADSGVCCKGCDAAGAARTVHPHRTAEDEKTIYSRPNFLVHFRSCSAAKRIWEDSAAGTAPFDAPPPPLSHSQFVRRFELAALAAPPPSYVSGDDEERRRQAVPGFSSSSSSSSSSFFSRAGTAPPMRSYYGPRQRPPPY